MASRTVCPGWPQKGRKRGKARREVEEEASQARSDREKPRKRRRGRRRRGKGARSRKGVEEGERRDNQDSIPILVPPRRR